MRHIPFNIHWIFEYLILVIHNFLNIMILAIIYLKLVIGIGRIYIHLINKQIGSYSFHTGCGLKFQFWSYFIRNRLENDGIHHFKHL